MDFLCAVNIAICLCFYHLGGMATTNIQRLTKGSTTSVTFSKCVCPACGSKIRLINQLPIISYMLCAGRCKDCKSKIPISTLVLEIVVFSGMSIVCAVFDFMPLGVMLSFFYYEIVRILFVFVCGRREVHFVKEYFFAVFMNIIPFLLIEFLAVLKCLYLHY